MSRSSPPSIGAAPAEKPASWIRWWLLALLGLAALAPFFVVTIPPLTDLPGHLGRYHIAAEIDTSAELQTYYAFEWLLTGNLGADLIVYALRDVVDVERATWAVALLCVVLLFAGVIAVSRVLHGAVQPTALLALPFIYSYMYLYGFLNYFLSAGLALLAFALWLRLDGRPISRAAIFVPLGLAVWLTHVVGWGLLAVMVGMHALWHAWQQEGRRILPVIGRTAKAIWPMVPPLVVTLLWRAGGDGLGMTGYSAEPLLDKAKMLTGVLQDQSFLLDMATLVAIWLTVSYSVRAGCIKADRPFLFAGAALALLALVMPARMFGSYYADARILPIAIMIGLLSLRWRGERRHSHLVAAIAAAVFLLRMGMTTHGWMVAERVYQSHLAALEKVPRGARILVQVQWTCHPPLWDGQVAVDHLGSMAIVRRDAFVNTQWQTPGAHGVRALYNRDIRFHADPSQYAPIADCPRRGAAPLDETLAAFPRDRFDFVWIFRTSLQPPHPPADLRVAYGDADSLLLEVIR